MNRPQLYMYENVQLDEENVVQFLTHSERRPQLFIPQGGNKPLLYHQIGNINFFIFITNQ